MTLLYLRYRARMALAVLKPQTRKDWGYRIFIVLMVVFNVPALAGMYWGVYGLFEMVADSYGPEALARLLHIPAAGYGVFVLFLVLNRVYPMLFETADHELLRSLPITPRRLTHLRLSAVAILLSPVLLLFLATAAIFGLVTGAAPEYYAISTVLVALYGLTLVSLGALLTSALAAVMASPGLRVLHRYGTALVLIPGVLATYFFVPRVREAMQVMDEALAVADRLAYGPGAWLVRGLAAAATGAGAGAMLAGAALVACIAICWGGSLSLSSRLFHRDAVDAAPPRTGVASTLGWWAPRWLGSPARAMLRREMTAVRAEAPRTLLTPVGMVVLFAVMGRVSAMPVPMTFVMVFIALTLVVGVTMPAVGQEGRAFWVLRSLPVPMWKVLAVKLALRLAIGLVTMALLAALVATLTPLPPLPIEKELLPVAVAMAVLAIVLGGAWGLATGARFPNFTPSRAGQYVGVGASLAGTFGAIAIAVTLGCSVLPLGIEALRALLWFLPLAMVAFWVGVVGAYLAWACWHLERLEL